MKKTWQEKLRDKASLPKVLRLEKRFPCYNAVHKMGAEVGDEVVLVNPSEVVEIMKQVPKGRLITIVEICKKIAKQHDVEACCSLTMRFFFNREVSIPNRVQNPSCALEQATLECDTSSRSGLL